ncbi:hypothetical protein P153DRAFT_363472 [Dothidotthia symphoricarpi CBS 119687]|uniref:Cora-domain-containing protein n=1 Tax=Dothidotthia symphoricarpi CBS 119687 TaxID=1392245 RepID=A0A6A6AQY6_9PLEO|nr:uncharacterized protein P153DRAFT_363472 [Dothidotthia symphoricarpi CBS 119687]KAF2133257.1 hypothetical protein P153DRAFT_363472 [Dothidotthia symphoricarpi CBS 119687]
MGTILVDSPFYLTPVAQHDAPLQDSPTFLSSESRAIDILYRKVDEKYRISYRADQVKTAQELCDILERTLVSSTTPMPGTHSLDRIYCENNWPFARSVLCRRFVKGLFNSPSAQPQPQPQPLPLKAQEDRALMNFQMFLNSSARRKELEFSYFGLGCTSNSVVMLGKQRLLYLFGFDWVAVPQGSDDQNAHLKILKTASGKKFIVRRRTCVASILKMKTTEALTKTPFFPSSWASDTTLLHRRTLILFNEFHSSSDGIAFQNWLTDPELWHVSSDSNTCEDNEATAALFTYRLTCKIWERVVQDWKNVIDRCSEHIRASELRVLDKDIDIDSLQELAQDTWRDTLDWSTLCQLMVIQRRCILDAQDYLNQLSKAAGAQTTSEEANLARFVEDLEEMKIILSENFPKRGQSISDLVFNIIGVRNAQAAERYSKEVGAVTWITFIFFPLIAVSGMFGMNVDLLADNPPIKWYFIIAIPATSLVLIVAILIRSRKWIRMRLSRPRRKVTKGSG